MSKDKDFEDLISKSIAKGIQEAKHKELKAKKSNGFFAIIVLILTFLGTGMIVITGIEVFGMEKHGELAGFLALIFGFLISFFLTFQGMKSDAEKLGRKIEFGHIILIIIGSSMFAYFMKLAWG